LNRGEADLSPARAAGEPALASARLWAVAAILALAAITAAAIVLRFYDLAANPGVGLYGDEASEGLDALKMLHQPGFHPDWLVWFQDDGGREALFAYVVAGAFHLFGEGLVVLRGTAAAFGVAGVLAIGMLGRRFGTWTGIVAAAWAAGSLWLVCVSRDGMRNTIVPLFGALALIALLRWAGRPGRGTATVAGAVTAVAALYTYQPLKLLPVLVIVWLLWLRRADRPRYEDLRAGFMPFVVAFLIVGAPMIAVAVTNPVNYFGRATEVSPLNPGVVADTSPIGHVLRTLGMFGFVGDQNGRHDVAALPLLPLPLVAVAAFGVVRLWRMRRDAGHALILLSLPVFLVPPLIATEGYSPHFLRVLGLAAPLGVTIGLGSAELVERARGRWGPRAGGVAVSLVSVGLAAVVVWSGMAYLSRSVADRYETFSYQYAAMGQYAVDHPGSAVIIDGFSATDIQFLYFHDQPAFFSPGTRIGNPGTYSTVVAASLGDLSKALGSDVAGRAQPVAWDPTGKPAVWAVSP
jgi:4-amino-4-deoxy-L-arabinose transferase-like glycosyltransferase